METLTSKYRPSSFSDLIGQDFNAGLLEKVVQTGTVPPGFLFTGPPGTGKTSAARILGNALGGDNLLEVDSASNSGVSNVRAIMNSLLYATGSEKNNVVIFDEAHRLSREAFDSMLKTLEEPPAGSVFVLVSTEPHNIPESIRDRLVEYEFRAVSGASILGRLEAVCAAEGLSMAHDLAEAIVSKSQGSVRRALMLLEQVSFSGITTVEEFNDQLGDRDYSVQLMNRMLDGDLVETYEFLDMVLLNVVSPSLVVDQLVHLMRDVVVIRNGGADKGTADWESRKEVAGRLSTAGAITAMRLMWDMRTLLRPGLTPSADLEMAIALIIREVSGADFSEPATNAPVSLEVDGEDEELSLADLHTFS